MCHCNWWRSNRIVGKRQNLDARNGSKRSVEEDSNASRLAAWRCFHVRPRSNLYTKATVFKPPKPELTSPTNLCPLQVAMLHGLQWHIVLPTSSQVQGA
jgi:hypothetical protein